MTIKKVTKSAQIRSYVAANPKAKPKQIAEALGTGLQYVYTVMHNAKRKAKVAKKATLTLPKDKLKEYEAKKTQEQVDRYWKAVGDVQKAALSSERIAELTAQAGKPKARMQSSADVNKEDWRQLGLFVSNTSIKKADPVNHPAHYKVGGIETIDFIEAKKLNYNIGNVVKYLTRADHKGNRLQDLRKAQWYLEREIWNAEDNKKTA